MSDELWSVAQVAEHWGVSESRARALLAKWRIKRYSGYASSEVKAVKRNPATTKDVDR